MPIVDLLNGDPLAPFVDFEVENNSTATGEPVPEFPVVVPNPLMRRGLAYLAVQLDRHGVQKIENAEIFVEDYGTDSFGEPVATNALEYVRVRCQVRPLSARQIADQGRDANKRMVRIYFFDRPFEEDDARSRLIRVGGRTYRPIDVLNRGSADTQWRLDCELVTG